MILNMGMQTKYESYLTYQPQDLQKKKCTEHKTCASFSVNTTHFNKYLPNYTSDTHSIHRSIYTVAVTSV